jgi:hypothetical protein
LIQSVGYAVAQKQVYRLTGMDGHPTPVLFQSETAGPCWHRFVRISSLGTRQWAYRLIFQCLAAGCRENRSNCLVTRVQEKDGRNGAA